MLSCEGRAGDCSYCCSNFQPRKRVLGSDIYIIYMYACNFQLRECALINDWSYPYMSILLFHNLVYCLYICMYGCMCMHLCVHLCMYVCVCVYAFVCVCMYVYMYKWNSEFVMPSSQPSSKSKCDGIDFLVIIRKIV